MTESSLKRDDWMLEPMSSQVTVVAEKPRLQLPTGDESLTEEYGEASQNARNLGGSVDFFSAMGTEKPKRPQPDRPNPDQVHLHLF